MFSALRGHGVRSSRLPLIVAVALAMALVAVAPALGKETHLLLYTFNGSEAPCIAFEGIIQGVAVDNSPSGKGEIYVANREHGAIDRFEDLGGSVKCTEQIDGLPKETPWGLAVDPSNGELYATEPEQGVVAKFEAAGKPAVGFGTGGQVSPASIPECDHGSSHGSVACPAGTPFGPAGVAVDPKTSELFVGDRNNDVIDVFGSNGEYKRQFEVKGSPESIAIDSMGDLFVVTDDGQIAENETNVYEAATGVLDIGYAKNPLETGGSLGVAVDPKDNDVYVSNTVTGAINQYSSIGGPVSSFGPGETDEFGYGIGAGEANSHLYVANNNFDDYVYVFGPLIAAAEPTTEPASEIKPASATLNGSVNPNGLAVSECFFEYGPTTAYGQKALCEPAASAIPTAEGEHAVHAKIALAPDTPYHFRLVAANINAKLYGADRAIALPTAEADTVHTVDGEGKLSVFGVVNPDGADTHYHFEFLTEQQFAEGAWAQAVSTPAQDAGAGGGGELVVQEIPGLQPGATYRYRVTAESAAFPGDPEHSQIARTLLVPAATGEQPQPPCPNEAERSGASARLPDCRAYEQVTPVNKEGAQDNFNYGNGERTVVGLDGEHLFMTTLSKWGLNVSGNQATTYSFTRTPEEGWKTSSLSPQPQTAGVFNRPYRFFTPDLSQVMIEREWETSLYASSSSVEFALGPPGGPYKTVASEPMELYGEGGRRTHFGHWVAQSRDGSVAVIESPDHELIPGHLTGTTSPTMHGGVSGQGFDLYEYSGGSLSQLNVDSQGRTIGTCGAQLAQGREGGGESGQGQGIEEEGGLPTAGSVNAVSEDGSRIFFEALCPSRELYMRVGGAQTVDIGEYTFEGANPQGTRLLLSKDGTEFFSYDTETQAAKRLFSLEGGALGNKHALSEDGEVFYFETSAALTPEAPAIGEKLYRYDIPSESMTFVAVSTANGGDGNGGFYVSPDGGDFYFNVESVQGVSGSGGGSHVQVYRYDSAEGVVQCVSCASPYNLEPKQLSTFMPRYGPNGNRLAPLGSPASANGDYVFFDTPAALLPQDIDGEIPPQSLGITGDSEFSPSSDVYEWRRDGVSGCGRVQGCLALITNGIDGTENVLLGTDPSGNDVFFATHSQLAPTDNDASADVYDARIGGGFQRPNPPPVECEGDACSTPVPAPNDATPSSFTFTGPGDLVPALATGPPAPNPPAAVKCAKGKTLSHGKCVKSRKKRAGTKPRRSSKAKRRA
jgi:hypothetical protein